MSRTICLAKYHALDNTVKYEIWYKIYQLQKQIHYISLHESIHHLNIIPVNGSIYHLRTHIIVQVQIMQI